MSTGNRFDFFSFRDNDDPLHIFRDLELPAGEPPPSIANRKELACRILTRNSEKLAGRTVATKYEHDDRTPEQEPIFGSTSIAIAFWKFIDDVISGRRFASKKHIRHIVKLVTKKIRSTVLDCDHDENAETGGLKWNHRRGLLQTFKVDHHNPNQNIAERFLSAVFRGVWNEVLMSRKFKNRRAWFQRHCEKSGVSPVDEFVAICVAWAFELKRWQSSKFPPRTLCRRRRFAAAVWRHYLSE